MAKLVSLKKRVGGDFVQSIGRVLDSRPAGDGFAPRARALETPVAFGTYAKA
jgi:hypothetical protein